LEKNKPDVWSLTFDGRHNDRIFLNSLTEEVFQEVSSELVRQLTDEVIEDAIRRLPQPIYNISSKWLERKLKDRRELMDEASRSFYKNYASHVEIVCRTKSEYVDINHVNNNDVDVKVFKRNEETGEKEGYPVYHRIFNKGETKEVRLYLMGGDDKVVTSGRFNNHILVRIIGGSGDDEFYDQSDGKTFVYDTKLNTKILENRRTVFKSGNIDSVINAHSYRPHYRNHGNLFIPWSFLYADSEDGLVLGAGIQIKNYSFRKEPYANSLFFRTRYAFGTSATQISFSGQKVCW